MQLGQVPQRTPKLAVWACSAAAMHAWLAGVHGAQAGGARARGAERCRGRTFATAASYSASLSRSCATWRGVFLHRSGRSVCGVAWLWAAQRYPLSFGMIWSAPPMSSRTAALVRPLNAAMCSAVFLPDGHGASATSGHRRHAPTGREGAPLAVLGVQVGARVDELLDDLCIAFHRRPHQRRHSTPAHGGAAEG